MDRDTFLDLLTPVGQSALADAAVLAPTETGFLAAFEILRKRYPSELAKAAIETVLLREMARVKFTSADHLYFTRESLEQASGELVSHYRAERFSEFKTVLDLCCGIGADTFSLARCGLRVTAWDNDPLRLEMAKANAAAYGLSDPVTFHLGDVTGLTLTDERAAYIDPSRRAGERRVLDPEQYYPPLGKVRSKLPADFPLAAKIAPGVSRTDLAKYDAGVEFISVDGELKECVLWFGPLRGEAIRATVLPGPHTLSAESPPLEPPPTEPQTYIFDPDPSVIRADLVPLLGEQLDAVPVEHGIAVLTGSHAVASHFAACHAVEQAAPFHLGKLRDYLRERRVGRVTMLKRAVELDVNDVMRKLKLDGPEHRTVMLVRSMGKPWAIILTASRLNLSSPSSRRLR